MGDSDASVLTLVDKAHAAGVKVLASLGGGGGDQTVIARYKTASNIEPMVANLDAFVKRLKLDGVDIDIESPPNMGSSTNYAAFVNEVVKFCVRRENWLRPPWLNTSSKERPATATHCSAPGISST